MSNPIEQRPIVRQDAVASEANIILRFVVLSAIHLLIGTVQGVMQTFPGIAQWLREAGPAGHMIDPLAHAHINLVGGVTMGMMGIFTFGEVIDDSAYAVARLNAFHGSTLSVTGLRSNHSAG